MGFLPVLSPRPTLLGTGQGKVTCSWGTDLEYPREPRLG